MGELEWHGVCMHHTQAHQDWHGCMPWMQAGHCPWLFVDVSGQACALWQPLHLHSARMWASMHHQASALASGHPEESLWFWVAITCADLGSPAGASSSKAGSSASAAGSVGAS